MMLNTVWKHKGKEASFPQGQMPKTSCVGDHLAPLVTHACKHANIFDTHKMWVSQVEDSGITSQVKASRSRRALNCQEAAVFPDGCSLVSLVKACAELRDVDRGRDLHAEIARKGLLECDVFAGNALVDMYAKCGLLKKAQETFESLQVHDVVSWTALIGGYATHGFGMEALKCFEQMQLKGVIPNRITHICILKACGCIGSIINGRRLHDEVERRGLLKEDLAVGNALVDMYAKCGMLADTRRVFEQLPLRDKISWSALIMGYTKGKEGVDALLCFKQMQLEGLFPDSITFICALKACGSVKNTSKGKEIHAAILSRGLLEMDLVMANTLIHMYADCGSLVEAHEMFHKLSIRDIISWNSLIDGCVKQEHGEEALHWTERMQLEGIFPDVITFVCCLKACGAMRAIHKGKELHAKVGSWEVEAVIGNALVDMYAKCGLISNAQEVFNKLAVRDVVTWTSLIAGYANYPSAEEALKCFQMMQVEGVSPNAATFVCVLKACGILGATNKSIYLHSEIARGGFFAKDVVVGNALVDTYAKCGMLTKAREVFNALHVRDVVSWNALMAGYANDDRGKEVLDCFARMELEGVSLNSISFICGLKASGCMGATFEGIEIHTEIARKGLLSRDALVGNALVNMYVKCGFLGKAKEVFHELPVQDIVSWTTLIAGYTQYEHAEEALYCIEQMQLQGITPDAATFVCGLKACKGAGAVNKGREIHAEIARRGFLEEDLVIGNSLVEMYATCGLLAKAHEVFNSLPVQDTKSWTALIEGYVQQGEIDCALHIFERMKDEGKQPDVVSFVCVLNACAYAGHVDTGQMYFEAMSKFHGISPSIEHYSCMVDLVSRAGLLERAVSIINQMPFDPDPVLWYILLDACEKWGNVEAGRNVFEHTICLDETDASPYVRMCNICAGIGMQQDMALRQQE